jgi:hypothetical protein
VHSHRTDVVKAGNYYAGHHTAQGTLVTVTRSGRTKPLGAGYDLWNKPPTGFSWGYNGSGPAQLALVILTGGKALAEALYEPFKFTVIAVLPDCWEMNSEEVGIALCRTLTEEPNRLNRVLCGLESAVLDEFVERRNTTTAQAATALTDLFQFNIPHRWSIAHLFQAILNKEFYIQDISGLPRAMGSIAASRASTDGRH